MSAPAALWRRYQSDCLHRGNDTVHIHAGRIGSDVRACPFALRTQLQLAPTRQQLSADTELVAEPPAGGDNLIRCLAVDIEDPCERKDQLQTLLIGHGLLSEQ